MKDWIELSSHPLDLARAATFVNDDAAGGINIFLGTTRGENHADGRALLALDYEAFGEMALEQLGKLASQARERWPVLRLAILHRTGRVAVGEPSVVIAVATAHRAASFEACRWLIDTLKTELAVWKKEVWADGSTSWVEGHPVKMP
jgi:molybdopterin synthase catalytic subunit